MAFSTLVVHLNDTQAISGLNRISDKWDKLQTKISSKGIDFKLDEDGKVLSRVEKLTDEYGRLVTVTTKLVKVKDEETGKYKEVERTTYRVSENLERQAKATSNVEKATVKKTSATKSDATATKELGDQTEKTTARTNALSDALKRLGTMALATVTNAFKDALKEMKAVDSALVTVRKVTDASAEDIEALRDRAYEVGKAYGVAASDYLSAAAAMARAGYKDQAGDLAELATKLQLVGDVSQDVANQFLIATDKSFKFNGDTAKLSETIDKANEIDNKYATTIEKIASGMGIIAPVSAQLNVSLDETMAAVGTISAVTQRSGTEAARALRAIMLNIVGDTKTEIEDGATWTAGEITGLRDLLKKYAPEIVEEAQKMGTVINPMEAIGALAKAYKDGLLNAQEITEMVSDIGGKLRTPQLLALIQNWDDTYLKMMDDIQNATGSADKEVENALTGWEAKLNILKNTWTDFVQETLNSQMIKDGIDTLTSIIDWFGSLGNALQIIIPLVIALKSQKISQWALDSANSFGSLVSSLNGANIALFAISAIITGLAIAYRAYNNSIQENIKTAATQTKKSLEEADSLSTLYENYKSVAKGSSDFKAASEKLVEALGIEKGKVDELSESYDTLFAKKQLENLGKARTDAESELQIAWAAADDPFNKMWERMGYLFREQLEPGKQGFNIERIGEKAYNLLSPFLVGQDALRFYSTSDSLELYKIVPQILDEIVKYSKEQNDPSLLQSFTPYSVLSAFRDTYSSVYDPVLAAEDNLRKINLEEKVIKDLVLDGEKTKSDIKDYLSKNKTDDADGYLSEILSKYYPQYFSETKQFKEETENAADSLSGLSAELGKAKGALETYQQALENGEKGDTFKSYSQMYERAKALFEKGLTGTNEYRAAMRALLGDELGSTFEYNYRKAGESVFGSESNLERIFSQKGEDYGLELARIIVENKDALQAAVDVVEEADGKYGIFVKDQELLASKLGFSKDVIAAGVEALDAYSEELVITDDDLKDLINTYSSAFKGNTIDGAIALDLGELIKGLTLDGHSAEYIMEVVHALENLQGVGKVSLDYEFIDDDHLLETINEAQDAKNQLAENDTLEFTVTPIDYTDINESFDAEVVELNKKAVITFKVVNHAIQSSTSPYFDGTEGTQAILNHGSRAARAAILADSNAEGRTKGKGGLALVNDGDGAELIADNGKAFIAGGGKPTIVSLSQDATVFTAEQTKDILHRSGINAFSGGYYVGGLDISGGNGSNGNGQKTSSEAKSEKEATDWLGLLDDYMSDLLKKAKDSLDEQYAVLEETSELEEARLNMLKSEKGLADANAERTVRYFNKATGQWEWMADQKAVQSASESLKDAQKSYLEAQYKALEDAWKDIQDIIKRAMEGSAELDGAAILAALGASAAGGSLSDVQTLISNIGSFASNPLGGINSSLLDYTKAASLLYPRSMLDSGLNLNHSLSALYGISTADPNAKGTNLITTMDRSSTTYGATYYINGVKIGSDMMDKPLSQILSVLPIYAN